MANLNEILVNWTTINGAGKVSVMHFQSSFSAASQRSALNTLLTGVAGALDNSCSYSIATSGRTFDDATGTLAGSWTDATARTGTGAGGGEPVADATQILLQWHTSNIVNGRFLQGRTYIPGCAVSNVINGNLSSSSVTGIQALQTTFLAAGVGFVVWHRPVAGSGGSSTLATTGTTWSEFAIQRRRRH